MSSTPLAQSVSLNRYYPDLTDEEMEYLSWLHRKKHKHWSDWVGSQEIPEI
jgi:hypothetical protein